MAFAFLSSVESYFWVSVFLCSCLGRVMELTRQSSAALLVMDPYAESGVHIGSPDSSISVYVMVDRQMNKFAQQT